MKKGLRRQVGAHQVGARRRERFPDEEGIKTTRGDGLAGSQNGRERLPDEEGIKTSRACVLCGGSTPSREIP